MNARQILLTVVLALCAGFIGGSTGNLLFTERPLKGRTLEVVNQSDYKVVQVRYRIHGKPRRWSEDMLGDDIIDPKNTFLLELDDQGRECVFDFLAILSTKERIQQMKVNVCEAPRKQWMVQNVTNRIVAEGAASK